MINDILNAVMAVFNNSKIQLERSGKRRSQFELKRSGKRRSQSNSQLCLRIENQKK